MISTATAEQTFTAASDAQTATDWRTATDAQARYEALTPRAQRDLRATLTRHDMRTDMDGAWDGHGMTLTIGTSDVVFVTRAGNVYTVEHAHADLKLGTDGQWHPGHAPQAVRWFTRQAVEETLLGMVRSYTY